MIIIVLFGRPCSDYAFYEPNRRDSYLFISSCLLGQSQWMFHENVMHIK